MASFTRLVRFIPKSSSDDINAKSDSDALIGEPVDLEVDVGTAAYETKPVEVHVYSGLSVLKPGQKTGRKEFVGRLLSPLAQMEVGTIRCVGLNYLNHAKEVNLPIPDIPTLFMKPSTALADPYPALTVIPEAFVGDDAADFESEVALVIGKAAKNVSEAQALDYLLGITAANDISSRKAQFAQSQWCYSKSFDGACPLGPALVHAAHIRDLAEIRITGTLNGAKVQDSKLDDLIFSIPKIISFLSQGTTLQPGTVIITGTPAGVGWSADPKITLHHGDEFRVSVSHGVGTLISRIVEGGRS
ncbi:uncharacterized protein I303_104101 [Kwoniella dejecticola CBS 10117]|uniref:Mitochondrial protein n=1 Tax=Kwoniella dejecticola CBS 10117 TaxID=1296121 RepID=A0A1A6A8L1_9TREE|nr:mitochondrial protein [Kwoniella dejecticola CBS 10117]OBR86396.1 mitochondrial protein [Kwoniella dejecticola CBS 10117]